MRIGILAIGASASLLAACSHVDEQTAAAAPAVILTSYAVGLEAQFEGERLTRRHETEFRTAIGSDEVFFTFFEDVPAGFFDLSDMDSETPRTLMVGVQPSLLDTGEILYRVHLAFQDDTGETPFGLAAAPELRVAMGETATVHLGHDAGEIYSSFTIDLSSQPAVD